VTRANRKLWSDYKRLKTTIEYCQGLEADTGIPVSALILEIDSFEEEQSTWVHPEKLSSLGGFSKISGLQAVLIAF